MSNSESNSLSHKQDVQAFVDELTIEGQALLLESDKPVLDEEEEDLFAIPPTTTMTSKIMIGGIEYETRAV